MGYDYSLQHLARHAAEVKKLADIAVSGEILCFESPEWVEIRKRQQLMNSLIANMDLNMEGMEGIRQTIRCWTAYKEGSTRTFQLFIGKPVHKIEGRPTRRKGEIPWMSSYAPLEDAIGGRYRHPARLDGANELETFIGKLMSLSSRYLRAEVRVEQLTEEAVRDYFAPLFKDQGWNARSDGDTLILERIDAAD